MPASSSTLELHFSTSKNCVTLARTVFFYEFSSAPLIATCGNPGASERANGVFRWGGAVLALAVLLVRSKSHSVNMNCDTPYVLEGNAGSLASSLDAALAKQPNWLLDMFGVDSGGSAIALKLLNRTNPERKHSGPVGIAINPMQLSTDRIRLFVDSEEIDSARIDLLIQRLSA